MKTWSVKTRGKDSKIVVIEVQAGDRKDLFNKLKQMGVSAIQITETTLRNTSNSKALFAKSKYIILALIAVLTIFVLCLLIYENKKVDNLAINEKPKSPIKNQSPKAIPSSPKKDVVIQEEPKKVVKERPKVGMWTDEDGNLRRPDGSYFWKNKEKPVTIDLTSRYPEQKAFKHTSEIALAHILQIKPGEPIENWVQYGEKFNEDFRQAMLSKIEILPSDSEEVKELKNAVIDLKDELSRRVRGGEDAAKIMNDTRAELQRMGELTKQIEDEAVSVVKGMSLSDDELVKFSDKVNQMLQDQNLPPLSNPKLFYIKMKYNTRKVKNEND